MKIACPIKHRKFGQHDLNVLRVVTQSGTGETATWYECPTGRYRWFIPEFQLADAMILGKPIDYEFLKRFQYNIPHWGWKKE